MGTKIIGLGKALPKLEVTNDELDTIVDASDDWVYPRTGIHSRHIAVEESTIDLARNAALAALGKPIADAEGWCESQIDPTSIDLVICGTLTPDTLMPSTAGALRRELGLENAVAFDMNAACCGFIYGVSVADGMLAASCSLPGGRQKMTRALVVGADRTTRILNWEDRGSCILFGDGAGAAVLEWDENEPGILSTFLRNVDDTKNSLACTNSFVAPVPFTKDGISLDAKGDPDPSLASMSAILGFSADQLDSLVHMSGQAVFKFASKALCTAIEVVLENAGLTMDDIALIVPHQANERIIRYAAKRLGLCMEMFQVCMENTGNTSAASVPIALVDAYAQGKIHKGDKIIAVGFGGGLTYGGLLFEA